MVNTTTLRAYLEDVSGMLDAGSTTKVITHCRYILQHYSQNVEAYRLLAQALLDRGARDGVDTYYDEALEVFQLVLSVIPNDAESHQCLSQIYEQRQMLDRAIWHMERAHEQYPGDQDLQDRLRELYAQRAGGHGPGKIPLTRGALARQYISAQLYDQALIELRTALEEVPERMDLQVLLAETLWESRHPVEAGEVAVQILKRLPYCLSANRIMARLWLDNERPTDAQVFLDRVEAVDPYAARNVLQPDSMLQDSIVLTRLDYDTHSQSSMSTETPEWLAELNAMAADAGPFTRLSSGAGDAGGWPAGDEMLGEMSQPATSPFVGMDDDWLGDEANVGAPVPPNTEAEAASEESFADWLGEMSGEPGEPESSAELAMSADWFTEMPDIDAAAGAGGDEVSPDAVIDQRLSVADADEMPGMAADLDLPAGWLGDASSEPVAEPGEMPNWLSETLGIPPPDADQGESVAADWMSETRLEDIPDEAAVEDDVAFADWLAEANQSENEFTLPPVEQETEPEQAADVDQDAEPAEIPGWLTETLGLPDEEQSLDLDEAAVAGQDVVDWDDEDSEMPSDEALFEDIPGAPKTSEPSAASSGFTELLAGVETRWGHESPDDVGDESEPEPPAWLADFANSDVLEQVAASGRPVEDADIGTEGLALDDLFAAEDESVSQALEEAHIADAFGVDEGDQGFDLDARSLTTDEAAEPTEATLGEEQAEAFMDQDKGDTPFGQGDEAQPDEQPEFAQFDNIDDDLTDEFVFSVPDDTQEDERLPGADDQGPDDEPTDMAAGMADADDLPDWMVEPEFDFFAPTSEATPPSDGQAAASVDEEVADQDEAPVMPDWLTGDEASSTGQQPAPVGDESTGEWLQAFDDVGDGGLEEVPPHEELFGDTPDSEATRSGEEASEPEADWVADDEFEMPSEAELFGGIDDAEAQTLADNAEQADSLEEALEIPDWLSDAAPVEEEELALPDDDLGALFDRQSEAAPESAVWDSALGTGLGDESSDQDKDLVWMQSDEVDDDWLGTLSTADSEQVLTASDDADIIPREQEEEPTIEALFGDETGAKEMPSADAEALDMETLFGDMESEREQAAIEPDAETAAAHTPDAELFDEALFDARDEFPSPEAEEWGIPETDFGSEELEELDADAAAAPEDDGARAGEMGDPESAEAIPMAEQDTIEDLLAQPYDPFEEGDPDNVPEYGSVGETGILQPGELPPWMAAFTGDEVPDEHEEAAESAEAMSEIDEAASDHEEIEDQAIELDWMVDESETGADDQPQDVDEDADSSEQIEDEDMLFGAGDQDDEPEEGGMPGWLAAITHSEADKLDSALFEDEEVYSGTVEESGVLQPDSETDWLTSLAGEDEVAEAVAQDGEETLTDEESQALEAHAADIGDVDFLEMEFDDEDEGIQDGTDEDEQLFAALGLEDVKAEVEDEEIPDLEALFGESELDEPPQAAETGFAPFDVTDEQEFEPGEEQEAKLEPGSGKFEIGDIVEEDVSDADLLAFEFGAPELVEFAIDEADDAELQFDLAEPMVIAPYETSERSIEQEVAERDDIAHTKVVDFEASAQAEDETDDEFGDDDLFAEDEFSFDDVEPLWLRQPKESQRVEEMPARGADAQTPEWLRDVFEDDEAEAGSDQEDNDDDDIGFDFD